MAPDPHASLQRTLMLGGVTFAGYIALSEPAINLVEHDTLAAIAWPAPAVAGAVLWRLPRRDWLVCLLAVFAAMLVIGKMDPLSWRTDVGFALLNVAEVALCAWLGQRFVDPRGRLDSVAAFTRFVLLIPVFAVALIAVFGATLAATALGTSWVAEWRTIFSGNGLAMLVVLPCVLSWWPDGANAPAAPAVSTARLIALPAIATSLMLVLLLNLLPLPEIVRPVLALLLLWTAIAGGLRGATLAALGVMACGIALIVLDLNVYYGDNVAGIRQFQIDLASLALLAGFAAVALAEQRRMIIRLARARRLETIGLMASEIAHDFNNVLSAAGGYVEAARDQLPADAPVQELLRASGAAVERGHDITTQILLAARQGQAAPQPVALRAAIADVEALARPQLARGIRLRFEYEGSPGLWVLADKKQLLRALLNLVLNAMKAARNEVVVRVGRQDGPPPPLVLGDVPAGGAVWIDVADDGPGVPEAMRAILFEPFHTERAAQGGHGLGLAIVAGVATAHGGGVAVLDNTPSGALFRLILPAAPDAAPTAADTIDTGAGPAGSGEGVLIVEADAGLREALEDWAAESGFAPEGYAGPDEALQALAAQPDGYAVLIVAGLGHAGQTNIMLTQRALQLRPSLHILAFGRPAFPDAPNARILWQNAPVSRGIVRHSLGVLWRRARTHDTPD